MGTPREERFDFGVPNSPSTCERRTLILLAVQSTSSQRNAMQLALPHPCHCRRAVHSAVECLVRSGPRVVDERLHLLELQEMDVDVGGYLRQLDALAWVDVRPLSGRVHRVLVDRRERPDVVADALRADAFAFHLRLEVNDVLAGHGREPAFLEERDEVHAEHRLHSGTRR